MTSISPVAEIAVAEKLGNLTISEDALPSPPLTASESGSATSSDPLAEPLTEDNTTPLTVKEDATHATTSQAPQQIPSYPKSRLTLLDRFIDQPRELRVAVIGGGLSGILAGVMLPAKVPNIKLNIYEKNHDFVS